MKKVMILSFFFLMAAFVVNGQTGLSKDTNNTEYHAENEGWLVSIDEAYKQSKATGKPIMANFTGSDWCGWCKRLTASVFVKPEFKKWAADNVILIELDFPRRTTLPEAVRKQNAALQQAFQVRGYPTVWVFNLDINKDTNQYQISALGKTGYAKTVADFTKACDAFIANGGKK